MKILIVDDRKSRREMFASYNPSLCTLLSNHNDILDFVEGNDCQKFIEDARKNKLDLAGYGLLCCHYTFVGVVESKILGACDKFNINLVFFSGQHTTSFFTHSNKVKILNMSAEHFYNNALEFLVKDAKENRLPSLIKAEFGNDYKLAILMNVREVLVEWREKHCAAEDYTMLGIEDEILEIIACQTLTDCIHSEAQYDEILLNEQINQITSSIEAIL